MIADVTLKQMTFTGVVLTGDISNYDSGHKKVMSRIETEVVRRTSPKGVAEIWEAIGASDLNVKVKGFTLFSEYCKASGSKSTSWGNTFITHCLVVHALLRHHNPGCIQPDDWQKILNKYSNIKIFSILSITQHPD
jgi:hypothetical protein